ncbi:MAG: TlpA family protein disulfide reductase [Spirochaetia bacterium]|nr:TlpA family protein disulfide reductase [Spirochaetia bacterium]
MNTPEKIKTKVVSYFNNLKKNKKRILFDIFIFLLIIIIIQFYQTRNLIDNGKKAPDFELLDLNNNQYKLKNYLGKPVLLYFFAPWCTVCKISSGRLNEYVNSIDNKEIIVLAIGLSYNNITELKEFKKEHELSVPVLAGFEQTGQDYKIPGFPTFYFIDKEGKIKSKTVGFTTETGIHLRSSW